MLSTSFFQLTIPKQSAQHIDAGIQVDISTRSNHPNYEPDSNPPARKHPFDVLTRYAPTYSQATRLIRTKVNPVTLANGIHGFLEALTCAFAWSEHAWDEWEAERIAYGHYD